MNPTLENPIDQLMANLPTRYNSADREVIKKAYEVAEKAHRGQTRNSGEPYINHCIAVASVLADLKMPYEVIAAGLLHDTVEDTSLTLTDIRDEFGDKICSFVDGVTKMTQMPRVSRGGEIEDDETFTPTAVFGRKEKMAAETLRKIFLASHEDIRVILIKLADRLHNMRTLSYMPDSKRRRIAQETFDIFAPIANRLGIWQIKWELEDLSFRYLQPEKYKEIAELLAKRRNERERSVEKIKQEITQLLGKYGIQAEVSGRPKHIYSIYKKMQKKEKPFKGIYDVRAVRVILPDSDNEKDKKEKEKEDHSACYIALGAIHSVWRPIPEEFDDYIGSPKNNHYQSLHTAVIYSDGDPLEVQIRTRSMNEGAEYGIAAHWRYKEGGKFDPKFEERLRDFRKMIELGQDAPDSKEYLELMQNDILFNKRVSVITPRGDMINLPAGSTPIDFAYAVHTDVGHHCRGAKINGTLVSLTYQLQSGDQVEIIDAKRGGPSRDWLNPSLHYVKSARARSKISLYFKKQDDSKNITEGRAALEREMQRLGVKTRDFDKLAKSLGYKTSDKMFVHLAIGEINISQIVAQLSNEDAELEDTLKANAPAPSPEKTSESVEVVGLKGAMKTFAKCCSPILGDFIVGYVTRGRGVTIHRIDCPNILKLQDRERLIQVDWGNVEQTFPTPIKIEAYDRPGLMRDVTNLLSEKNININNVSVNINRNIADLRLTIEVKTVGQLSEILTQIRNLTNVTEAYRYKPG
ncbi:MAG: bifunctional (p)ppGpp synthetase/guanosine-3',5'-bis(diphosphate) 3'-pyrophosphohydrolase [Anaerolineales bacterium]|nr:bifunctional (p)ppGpp synthetase/guanosine-3',5'-bis(diphosphate) 3'-pyrophosphohydrolase [Anaerolineales bacterium]